MLVFYRNEDCASCAAIEETLDALVLAHRTEVLSPGAEPDPPLPEGVKPPALLDEGRWVQGQPAILEHLKELAAFKQEWEKFQTDACYCDEKGEVL